MTAPTAIRTEGLVKEFGRARFRALDGLDLEVRTGEVLGFLGPNGAGKSTTIRVLLDLLRPTAGRVAVLGEDPARSGPGLRARIGYLPGELHLGGDRTAGELVAHLTRLRGGAGADRVPELAERFGLALDRRIGGLSKGNKQKVGIVQAFAHDPELLVLDEPTSGLDPLLQREFLDLVTEARDRGATVLMSSHVLSEVEHVAGRVAIIRAGRIVDVDDVRALRERAGQRVEVRWHEPVTADGLAPLRAIAGVEALEVDGRTARCLLHGPPDELLQAVTAAGAVERFVAEDRELEDLFLDVYRSPIAATTAATTAPTTTGLAEGDLAEDRHEEDDRV